MSDSAHQQHRKLASAEAAAFARVLVAGGPAAPASIALFGDSASSKGLFVDRVMSKIRELTQDELAGTTSAANAPAQGRLAVVRFHPLPGEQSQLWGHFVEHLFSELKLGPVPAGEAVDADPLAAQLTHTFKLDDQAVRVMRARERVARAEEGLERARQAYESIYGKRIRNDETVTSEVTQEVFDKHLSADKTRLARFSRDLGVRNMDVATIQSLMADASTRFGRMRMLASSLITVARRRPLIFFVTTVLSILATAAATVAFDSIGIDYIAKFMPEAIARPIGDFAVALTAAVVAFRIGMFGPARAISYLRGIEDEIEMTVARELGREKAKASAKVTVLAKRETGFGDARQVLTAAERELESARAELASASPGGNPGDEPPARPPRSLRPAKARTASSSQTDVSVPGAEGADEYAKNTGDDESADADEAQADDDAAVVEELSASAQAEVKAEVKPPQVPIGRVVVFMEGLDKCGPNALADALRAIDALLTMPQFSVFAVFDQERINKTLRRETDKRAVVNEEDEGAGVARRTTEDPAPGAGQTTLSDDYLCGRFDTFYWIRDEVEPNLAHNSASVAEHLGELASENEDDWWYQLGSDSADSSADVTEPIVLSQHERRLIQKLDVIANQTPGGGQRLVHAYYLIKTAIGSAANEGFVGLEGERPHYRAVLAQLGFICGLPRLFERYVAVQSTSARRNEDMYGLIQRLRRLHFDRIRGGGRYMEILRMLEELDPGRGMVHALAHHANTVARFSISSPELVPMFDPPRNREEANSTRV
ncbi:MAG TPA: P-loop NTPase fold protein [Pararobbsia sp.]|nr:P-loop NTPase fold protein [Pararobbsia sp.]